MDKLKKGEFYGKHYKKSTFENIIITDTEYTHSKVDWHYHETPYFTYLLQGKLFESNKKESYLLEPGSLLFHNWQDAHYNIKPPQYTRGFHIELNENWFSNVDIEMIDFEGSMQLKSPWIKNLVNQIFLESKINDQYSNLSIETALIDIFGTIKKTENKILKRPIWVNRLQELLLEENRSYSLKNLSGILEIHPVHLSREFRRYFGTTLGNYMRLIKLNKAFHLLALNQFSLTEICYQCGFYDQSHFINNFKSVYHTTPSRFLKQIS
ncbi:AraC family transcriptional regulator [Putridiphycobacter roseus]|uniref:AraC family transcriptional regulator n=1 Tax=Putridiphycobacter roseus TaxID=2219161 RepID=A0A2W1NG52_9FLAO|nr:helix-turn-helix domain-containing protein [Putridiphycobacter roseus]PZE18073.1 AraC family transcriptional regulator [Putridiphycobacter roseus]